MISQTIRSAERTPSLPCRTNRRGAFTGPVCGLVLSVVLTAAGCQDVRLTGAERIETAQQRYARVGKEIESDPKAYLHKLYERCAALDEYTLTFRRQERLGLIPRLMEMEVIKAAFRAEPFSVKFVWTDPESDYIESVYVEGENENKLVVRERKGVLFAPPQTRYVDIMLPVKIGKAKSPITLFGLANMVKRTLEPIEDPLLADDIEFEYKGLARLKPSNHTVHHLEIRRPVRGPWIHAKQDFFVNAQTLLPIGTDLWLRNDVLDARYRFTDVDTGVDLTDEDFRLSEDIPQTESKPAKPRDKSASTAN